MPLPAPLRSLQADLPACPRVLLELQTLMRDDERALPEIAALIESDMALAAAAKAPPLEGLEKLFPLRETPEGKDR